MAKKTLVQDIMTRDPLTVTPETSLIDAYELMTDSEIRRLPVVTNELVGIVTLSDILGSIPSLLAEADVETKLLLSAQGAKRHVVEPFGGQSGRHDSGRSRTHA